MYCTIENLTDLYSEAIVAQLADDRGGRVIDSKVRGILSSYIEQASDEIDSYISGRYSLPLAFESPILQRISLQLVRYYLHGRRPKSMPTEVKDSYNAALLKLEKIASGTYSIEPETRTPTGSVIRTNKDGSGRDRTKRMVREFKRER
jgi:phage gp36-like protein